MTVQLLCGDCLDLMRDLPDGSVDAVITDPPYDWPLSRQQKYQEEMERVSRGWVIVFCPPENRWPHIADLDCQHLFWIKPISTKNTTRRYARFVEEILVYGNGLWDNSRHWSQYSNVFFDLVDSKAHPHAKPLSLITRLVLNHTERDGVVADFFMGSGTVGVACAQTGRKFLGCEIDPYSFEIAQGRIAEAQAQPALPLIEAAE